MFLFLSGIFHELRGGSVSYPQAAKRRCKSRSDVPSQQLLSYKAMSKHAPTDSVSVANTNRLSSRLIRGVCVCVCEWGGCQRTVSPLQEAPWLQKRSRSSSSVVLDLPVKSWTATVLPPSRSDIWQPLLHCQMKK